MHPPRREAPSPPLEGEVVERQRNRRGLYVNRAVQETPQSVLPVPKSRQNCQLPFQGRPWQNRHPVPLSIRLNSVSQWADAIRPYSSSGKLLLFNRMLAIIVEVLIHSPGGILGQQPLQLGQGRFPNGLDGLELL